MIWSIQGIFNERKSPNSPNFERKKFQIARFLWWVLIGSQKYKKILSFFFLSHLISLVQKCQFATIICDQKIVTIKLCN